jgi:hypothetical protein
VFNKTIVAVTAAVALGCMPVATNALAADRSGGGHSGGHTLSRHARGVRGMSAIPCSYGISGHSTDAVSQKAFGRAIDFPHQSPEPKRPARLISAR